MKITEEIQDNCTILNMEGTLSVEQINQLENSLHKSYKAGKHVILQLSEVTFIDSSSIGLIVLFMTKFRSIEKYLILVGPKREIDQMFNITGVSKHIKMFATLSQAFELINQ